jgi:hypothetical protein
MHRARRKLLPQKAAHAATVEALGGLASLEGLPTKTHVLATPVAFRTRCCARRR